MIGSSLSRNSSKLVAQESYGRSEPKDHWAPSDNHHDPLIVGQRSALLCEGI